MGFFSRAPSAMQWSNKDASKAPTPKDKDFDGNALFETAWENALDRDLLKLIVAEAMTGLEAAAAEGKFKTKVALPDPVDRNVYIAELEKAFKGRGVGVRVGRHFGSTGSTDVPEFTFTLEYKAEAEAAADKDMEEVN